ncbi:hypothetical protein KSS87_020304, partial [Heliosperma pusillum]
FGQLGGISGRFTLFISSHAILSYISSHCLKYYFPFHSFFSSLLFSVVILSPVSELISSQAIISNFSLFYIIVWPKSIIIRLLLREDD